MTWTEWAVFIAAAITFTALGVTLATARVALAFRKDEMAANEQLEQWRQWYLATVSEDRAGMYALLHPALAGVEGGVIGEGGQEPSVEIAVVPHEPIPAPPVSEPEVKIESIPVKPRVYAPRPVAMKRAHEAGMTWAQVGKPYGMTADQARRFVAKATR